MNTHLGMKLYRERKGRRAGDRESLDQAVGCSGFDPQALSKPVDPLMMERIDGHALLANQARKHAAWCDVDVVAVVVPAFDRSCVITFAVIEATRARVDRRIERASEGHIHFLKAAAYAENGYAGGYDSPNQRQHGCIARQVEQHLVGRRRSSIARGRYVGGTAGEQDAVNAIDEAVGIESSRFGGKAQCHNAGTLRRCADISVQDGMRSVAMPIDPIGGNDHERTAESVAGHVQGNL